MSSKKYPSPILICVAAISFNLLGSFVVRHFNLPLFLDTGGTIFVAMLSGYVPGIVVGFATNFINSFAEESQMYYCSISIFVAIYTTFLARRGYFQKLSKTLLTIPALAFITSSATVFIENFLMCTGVVEVINGIQMTFTAIFLREIVDKGLLVLIMFVAVKFVPQQIKTFFREWGLRQAPLTAELKRAVYERKCPRSSLRTKVLLMLTLSALFIAVSIALISYRIFEQAAFHAQVKIAESLATVASNEINPARIDDYIKFGRAAPDYVAVEKKLCAVKNSNTDISLLYVCKITEEGCYIVFDANHVADRTYAPGELISLIDDIQLYNDDLIAGNPVPPILFDSAQGQMLTVHKPVYDANGRCACYIAIDFSMSLISEYGRTFISKVLALFSGCFVFVFVLGLRFVENNIILPVNAMDYCTRGFTYDSESVCKNNVDQLKRLKIHTGDEIENLYYALLNTTQDVLNYLNKFRQAKRQVKEMDELAHTDSLTGIKNKAAYDEATAQLDDKILVNAAKFCIIMIDVNYLKRVNDTYGHERGNEYLINAVKLICAIFGEEHVYRIGGDEFVVILEDDKADLCKYFVTQFKAESDRKNFNASARPWEKVSAAIGASFYEPGVDKHAEEVFKRADAQMYENKLAMKAARMD